MKPYCLCQQMGRRRGSREIEPRPLAPLASQDPIDQFDGLQEGKEEEEEEVMRISPRSDSPRGEFSTSIIIQLIIGIFIRT